MGDNVPCQKATRGGHASPNSKCFRGRGKGVNDYITHLDLRIVLADLKRVSVAVI